MEQFGFIFEKGENMHPSRSQFRQQKKKSSNVEEKEGRENVGVFILLRRR